MSLSRHETSPAPKWTGALKYFAPVTRKAHVATDAFFANLPRAREADGRSPVSAVIDNIGIDPPILFAVKSSPDIRL